VKSTVFKFIRITFLFHFFLYTNQAQAMSFLNFMRVYIFSEVDGVVLINGEPVSGAEVIRTADYKDKIHSNTAITDEQGQFHFDDIFTYSMRLSETVILQKIMIHYGGEEYLAWELLKRNDNRYGELNDPETPEKPIKKLHLRCELTGDQKNEQVIKFEFLDRIIYGLCRWD